MVFPLKCSNVCLNNYKKSTFFDEYCQILIPPLENSPRSPIVSSDLLFIRC